MEDGPPIFSQDITCPDLLIASLVPQSYFRVRGYHPLSPDFPDRSSNHVCYHLQAVPRSLAATNGISFDFFSFRVLRCFSSLSSPLTPMYSVQDTCLITGGFPHSEISGSKSGCRLPEAYRRLLRPSSPLTAKASTVCA